MNRLRIGWGAVLFGVALLLGQSVFSYAETLVAGSAADVVDSGNTHCPVSGRPVDHKITAVYKGKRYAFCMKDCLEQFNKDPEKYLAKMKA